jgi:hypothetical protein
VAPDEAADCPDLHLVDLTAKGVPDIVLTYPQGGNYFFQVCAFTLFLGLLMWTSGVLPILLLCPVSSLFPMAWASQAVDIVLTCPQGGNYSFRSVSSSAAVDGQLWYDASSPLGENVV